MDKEIKRGHYTLYDGKEYRISKKQDGSYGLISHDQEDLEKGFEDITNEYDKIAFFKKRVSPAEVGEVFKVYTIAIYHGLPVGIESYHDNKILLATSDPVFLKEHGFKEVDRMVYMKEVNRDEVELVDKRELIPNFFDS